MIMERIFYYGFAALMGALVALSIVVIMNSSTNPAVAYVGAAALLIVLFDTFRREFTIQNNHRAVGFVVILFIAAAVSTIASLHLIGGAS